MIVVESRSARYPVRRRPASRWPVPFAVIGIAFAGASLNAMADPTRFLVIRYDDYAPVTPYDRGSNGIEIEQRLFDMVARHHVRLSVGVIPFPVADIDAPEHDPAKITPSDSWLAEPDNPWVRLLREYVDRGVVEPALHGFEHRRRSALGHRPGEFRNQSFEWQRAAITLGRDALSSAIGGPVRVFVPPWNAWDANTAKVLAALNFTWLSPDLHHAELPPDAIRVVPQCTANPAEALAWMRDPKLTAPGAVVVLVTHPFDFNQSRDREGAEFSTGKTYFNDLEQLLRFVNDSPDWKAVGFEDLPLATPAESHRRFRDAVAWDHARAMLADLPGLGAFLAPQPAPYRPDGWYTRQISRLQWIAAAVMALTALVGCLLAVLIARRVPHSAMIARIGAAATAVALIVLIVGAVMIVRHDYLIRGIRWQAICGMGGALIGFATVAIRRTARRVASGHLDTSRSTHERDEHPIGSI
jgi:predicted deacetylase